MPESPTIDMFSGFEKNEKPTSHKEVITHILSLIKSEDLKPGQALPGERVLAERFEVGRASIRVALKFLEFIGAVEISVGKGAFVSEKAASHFFIPMMDLLQIVNENPFRDLFETRRVIETKMAELAAQKATPEDIVAMKQALDEMEEDIKQRGTGVSGTDSFHMAIYRASKNIILYNIGMMLQGLMHESRGITLRKPRRRQLSLEEHREILAAIEKRNSILAMELMDKHLSGVERMQQEDSSGEDNDV